MKIPWQMVAGWYHAGLMAALPWIAWWRPSWAPLIVAGAALVHLNVRRSRAAEPWSSAAVALSAAAFLMTTSGWRGAIGFWLAVAVAVVAAARWLPRADGGRPDASDWVTAVGWAVPFAVRPGLLAGGAGGWLAPALLLLAARQLGVDARGARARRRRWTGPPLREVRGTLSLRGVVATESRLPATVPLDLDLRAGESLAVVCHDPMAAQTLADVLSGRSRPFRGEILIDGAPLAGDDRLVAVVAPGEPFVVGTLDDNLGALRDEAPDRAALGAARDACALAEVVDALGGRPLAADGSPLEPAHRLRLLAARVLVSHHRLLVVVDPCPWVDARAGELWRAAVVRASVGRTAIWITPDPDLAARADHRCEFVEGALRSL
jgi:ABC-type multidrug transport system fused ATPase/permease subunit